MCYRKLKELIKHNNAISRMENRPLDKWIKSRVISFSGEKKGLRTGTLYKDCLAFREEQDRGNILSDIKIPTWKSLSILRVMIH